MPRVSPRVEITLLIVACQAHIAETVLGPGWASTSVNAGTFRTNSVGSDKDRQLAAYHDSTGDVVLAKRLKRSRSNAC
ncbi:hypothetical protein RT717_28310 [Imperialibacter roseus]|uniref:Secreted protein n=1 Tax=Imperialibacter roseus TaxID=1324217 RepID=A0ABZ0IR54_9BACT|nr:hypothetical protein [Imperialibacter roseus]WOK06972.1 hypothetical protein RT717_28310 [Imperialibacter roseus]